MPKTRSGEFDQFKYQNDYNRQNYDHITLMVKKGQKDVIKAAAKAAGQSMSEYINQAINERLAAK